jgi:hypothetical protein
LRQYSFILCGRPDVARRPCPLAQDKWVGIRVAHEKILLGLYYNTRCLIVGMPKDYIAEVHDLLTSTWHSNRKSFTLSELQKLLGKVARLGMGCNWVYHLLSHLYQSTAFVISKNTQLGGPAQNDLEPNHKSEKFGPLRPSQNSYIYLTGDVQTTLTFSSPITIATMPSMHTFVSNIGCKCQSNHQKFSSAHQILRF